MGNRNRNTAILLIAAGSFILLGNMIGFFTIIGGFMIWFGIHKIRSGEDKTGYVLLAIGFLFFLGDHLSFVIAIIFISLGYYFIRSKQLQDKGPHIQKQHIMESIKWNRDPWVLQNMSVWSLIGEIHLDLSLALAEEKETTIILQGIIGDIDLIVPEEMGISISSSVIFGQIHIVKEQDAGLLNKVHWKSDNYEQSEYRVKIMTSHIIGDVDVKIL
ncbi:cell wall-active antibiotics response protein LiaF [Marinicrinis lubricantis]|uniref:Cell wall-active antibiotics response protein LiaF n=1 Tax=Marinicrinis lubricantis TaxID=2086470 RepID=A0ABW1IJ92_9BACL